ncbi:MAG: hypothetical protein LBR19_01390 [Bifidobacteriaceae bacterium]|jgi:hypothetical protein|nr:hypothetical protein [Bifidobacteriaceae bacterium]
MRKRNRKAAIGLALLFGVSGAFGLTAAAEHQDPPPTAPAAMAAAGPQRQADKALGHYIGLTTGSLSIAGATGLLIVARRRALPTVPQEADTY